MSDLEEIIEIAKNNNNIFKTKMVVDAGIRKERIKELLDTGTIKKLGAGYYMISGEFVDRFYELQLRCPKAIYSYGTAAFLLGIIDSMPEEVECTFPRGYNASRLEFRFETKYHFVDEEYYSMGITEIITPYGSKIKVYDKERIVCDFIKNRARCDIRVWGSVLNSYFKRRDKDLKKLIKYAKAFHILDDLEMYVELLQ